MKQLLESWNSPKVYKDSAKLTKNKISTLNDCSCLCGTSLYLFKIGTLLLSISSCLLLSWGLLSDQTSLLFLREVFWISTKSPIRIPFAAFNSSMKWTLRELWQDCFLTGHICMCFVLHEGEFVHSHVCFCNEWKATSNRKTSKLKEHTLRGRWGNNRGQAAQNGHVDPTAYSKKKKCSRQRRRWRC